MVRLQKTRAWVPAIVGTALFIAMTLAIYERGPWYDEFFTRYVTRPGPGLTTLWSAWLRDNHPPLFYFLVWSTNFLGDSFAQRRFLNLAFLLIGSAALFILCRARPALRPLAIPYVIALASFLPAIDNGSELRSYFLAYITTAITVAALTELARPHQPRSRRALVFLTVALALSFSVHLASTIIVGAVSAVFGLRLLLMRDWRGAKQLALAGGVAVAPFVGITVLQLSAIAHNTQSFWIPAGLDGAIRTLFFEIYYDFTMDWPLTVVGIIGLAVLGVKTLREWRLSDPAGLVLTLGVGLLLAMAILLAVHLQRPFIAGRYLVSLHAPVAMILAVGVVTLMADAKAWVAVLVDVAIVLGALFAIHSSLRRTLARPSWNGTGAAIGQMVADCPGAIVYSNMHWNELARILPPVENRAAFPYAYAWVAHHNGFRLAPPASRELAKGCPTVFWTEHVHALHPTAEAVGNALRQSGFPIHNGVLKRIGDGWLYIVPPDPGTAG